MVVAPRTMAVAHKIMEAIMEMSAAWAVAINGMRVHKAAGVTKEGQVAIMADVEEVAVQMRTTDHGMTGT